MEYVLACWTLVCVGIGWWLRGVTNYQRQMESVGMAIHPTTALVGEPKEVEDEQKIRLDQEP